MYSNNQFKIKHILINLYQVSNFKMDKDNKYNSLLDINRM